jgi:hypothetical protein
MTRKPWPPVARLAPAAYGSDLGAVEPDGQVEVYPGLMIDEGEAYRLLGLDAEATDTEILALLADRAEARRVRAIVPADPTDDDFGGWAA